VAAYNARVPRTQLLTRLAAVVACLVLPLTVCAQTGQTGSLVDMSIEDLMNVRVTTVSKRDQNLRDTAAAISVISNDDLRRAGATSLPEALRLVVGMNVAAVNGREWAVSARGFNFVFASKLLVLIDGRTVYTPLYAGVAWPLRQVMLEDVDRIEVIRGPGAAIWGANAVNGVINVVTRSSQDTQGTFLSAGGGDVLQGTVEARYGGQINRNLSYRVSGSAESHDNFVLADGAPATDGWGARSAGFRFDRYSTDERTQLTLLGDGTGIWTHPDGFESYTTSALARWSRRSSSRSNVEVQGFHDRQATNQKVRSRNITDTFDVTFQQTAGVGARNDVVWGAGHRFIRNQFFQTNPNVQIRNPGFDLRLFSVFVQDEFSLVPDAVTLTAGVKIEHNDFTGFEVQPTVRAMIKPSRQQTVWTAFSRAVRTPSTIQGKDVNGIVVGAPFVGPGGGRYSPTITGNGDPLSEILWAYELGYRVQPAARVGVDLAAFYNRYGGLITTAGVSRFVPGSPVGTAEIPFKNLLDATTQGLEATVTMAPSTASRVTLLYALTYQDLRGPANADLSLISAPPRNQLSIRTGYNFRPNLSIDGQLRYVGKIPGTPDYLTADLHLLFRPVDRFEFAILAQDLLDRHHPEQGPAPITTITETPRRIYATLTWRLGSSRRPAP
jgi:iron complex outermembrane recepter protein